MGSEDIIHCNAARLRIYGNGTVQFQLRALGNADLISSAEAQDLQEAVLDDFTFRTVTKLANFKSQRMQLKVYTDEIGDVMICSRIIIFVKPLWTGYVG